MLRNVTLTLLLFIALIGSANAQTGAIKGKVIDKATNEPLPFASVVAEQGGTQVGGAQTDFDGNFTIKPLNPGKYNIKATFVGYQTAQVNDVVVSIDKITFQDIKVGKGAVDITQIDIVDYKVPLIDKGNPATQTTITAEEIQAIPTRDVKSVAATAAGTYQRDEGDDINIRGTRGNATDYYIDGVRVRGSAQVPQSSIEQVTVVTGGVPAQYGDATGGIVSITSKGPSDKISAGIEIQTSQFLDKFGYNLGSLNISAPLIKKEENGQKRTILGIFAAGEIISELDADPPAVGFYKVSDDHYNKITKDPQILSTTAGGISTQRSGEFTTRDLIEKQAFKENNERLSYTANLNLDFQPVKNINLKVGGSYSFSDSKDYQYNYAMFNYENQPQFLRTAYRGFARFTQRFGNNTESKDNKSLFKNTYYSVQFDYSKQKTVEQSERHKDNIFDYGYYGKFQQVAGYGPIQTGPIAFEGDTADFFTVYGNQYSIYTPGGLNPLVENYTIQMLNYSSPGYFNGGYTNTGLYQTDLVISQNGGIINGGNAPNIYSMWAAPGQTFSRYRIFDNDQFRGTFQFSTDIKNHAVSVGFEYDQTFERGYGIGPVGLWSTMRNLANISPTLVGDKIGDTLYLSNIYNYSAPNFAEGEYIGFYENLRAKLGVGNDQYVDFNSLDPSILSMDLFAPDEFTGFNFGYTQAGKRISKASSPDVFYDYFSKRDPVTNAFVREIPAWAPVYMAGYIQDQFAINDLIFNVGLRVDRFDANQVVLKDKYLLYEAKTVKDIAGLNAPDNIGDDYVVYVSSLSNSTTVDQIVGYRNGDDWFDQDGSPVSDPSIIALQSASGKILPWLVEPSNSIKVTDARGRYDARKTFEDYTPQFTFMPRIAFQFDINDKAQFFANYSILTQRPARVWRGDPSNYYDWGNAQNSVAISNPDLKPERTTNYEAGFSQILSRSSVLKISAFYKELKQMIQQRNVIYAHPFDYQTFDNIDFGTVKGFTFFYDLRRSGNIRMIASYTLQFADGTGSADNSANNLINTSQPNLRSIVPLDFDQRHNFLVSFDYRYGSGKDYNGPVWFSKQVFADAGVHLEYRAGSGTPYTKQYTATNENDNIGLQTLGSSKTKGGVNAARLPWQMRFDLRVDKDFKLGLGKNREDKKDIYLNVSLTVQNLLNAKNIISVYRYTGAQDDDGFLASTFGQQRLNTLPEEQRQAYMDMYEIKENRPDNYSIPRRIKLGLQLNF